MTQRTYKGRVAPGWAEYVVIGPLGNNPYWANSNLAVSIDTGVYCTRHTEYGWRREELDPLPVEEVWGVFGVGSVVDTKLLNTYRTEETAADKAHELARGYTGRTFIVARITQRITQPKPILPEPIVEKL